MWMSSQTPEGMDGNAPPLNGLDGVPDSMV